jgi:hypothetical protein
VAPAEESPTEPSVEEPEPPDEASTATEEPAAPEPVEETAAPEPSEQKPNPSDVEAFQPEGESEPAPRQERQSWTPDVSYDTGTTYPEEGVDSLPAPSSDDEVAAMYISADTAAGRPVSPVDTGFISPTSYLLLAAAISALLILFVRWGDRRG